MALLLHIQDSLNKILVMSMKVLRAQLVLSVLPYICLDFKIGHKQFLHLTPIHCWYCSVYSSFKKYTMNAMNPRAEKYK
jgi:hypothetical protein